MNEELAKDFWNQVNEIEQLSCKVNSCQSIIAICAERALGDDSGALWAASDILNDIESKLDDKVHNLLMIYRQIKEPVKKAKKK
jgi:hypothetical protein